MKEHPNHGLIVYTDGSGSAEFNRVLVHPDEMLEVVRPADSPEESVIVYDCWGIEWIAQSTWDADGNGKPRQSVALTPCHVHLLNSQIGAQIYDVNRHGGLN